MNILAFDTSGPILSAALLRDGMPGLEWEGDASSKHAEALVPALQSVMKSARLTPRRLDAIAVGVGPGSFTGLRIGVAAGQMLAEIWEKKVVGISALEALAREAFRRGAARVAVALDARKELLYAAVYEKRSQGINAVQAPALFSPAVFTKRFSENCFLLHDGRVLEKKQSQSFKEQSSEPEALKVKALRLAEAARERILQGENGKPEDLRPMYLHPKECNVTLRKSI